MRAAMQWNKIILQTLFMTYDLLIALKVEKRSRYQMMVLVDCDKIFYQLFLANPCEWMSESFCFITARQVQKPQYCLVVR